jgi:hypothetical protein
MEEVEQPAPKVSTELPVENPLTTQQKIKRTVEVGAENAQRCKRCTARNQACHKQKGRGRSCSECAILKTTCTWPESDEAPYSLQERLVEASEERNALLKESVNVNRGIMGALVGIQESMEQGVVLQRTALREGREFRAQQRVQSLALQEVLEGVREELNDYLHARGWETESDTESGGSENAADAAEKEVGEEEVEDLLEERRENAGKGREGEPERNL